MGPYLKSIIGHTGATRLLTALRRQRTVILTYHDLRADDDFENWLRVSEADFAYQLTHLGRIGTFITPDQLDTPPPDNRLRFLVTFDDGYVNNHDLALPILQRLRIPALFFVSTRHMQEQEHFWPDLIVTPIQARGLERLDLGPFGLGEFGFRPTDSPGRWDDVQALLSAVKGIGNIDHPVVADILGFFRDEYRDTLAEHLPRFRPLTAAEVGVMAADPLIHVGSHSHHHDILTYQDDAAVDDNLETSRGILEELTGQAVTHLAYPNGNHDERIRQRVAAAGYTHAHAVVPGTIDRSTDRLALPRLAIGGTEPRSLPFFKLNRTLIKELLR